MRLQDRPYQSFAALAMGFALIAVGFKASKDLSATSAETARMADLREVGNRKVAGACLELNSKQILTVGRTIELSGSPTSCFHNAPTRQYAYAGTLHGRFQIIRVFTDVEVNKGATE